MFGSAKCDALFIYFYLNLVGFKDLHIFLKLRLFQFYFVRNLHSQAQLPMLIANPKIRFCRQSLEWHQPLYILVFNLEQAEYDDLLD